MSNQKKVTVYDLDNNPHKMTHLNARDMMQHNGWTLTPVDRAALAKAAELDSEGDDDDAESEIDVSLLEKELNGKTKAEMIALAAERFELRINGRKSESEVIKAILAAAKKAAGQPEDEDEDQDEGEAEGNE